MPKPPNPDDRSDNVEHLQDALDDTMENVHETRDYLKAHQGAVSPEQRSDLERKQERREDAIRGFRREIQDEAEDPH